jgi:hypothetical protein
MNAGPPREGPVVIERHTKGGRTLFYRLEVIQQPERARACGSGPKCKHENANHSALSLPSKSAVFA